MAVAKSCAASWSGSLVIGSALAVALPPTDASAEILVHSAERSVSVAVDVSGTDPFKTIDAEFHSGGGFWAADIGATYSPSTFASATQTTNISSRGITGTHHVTGAASLDAGMSGAVAGGMSQVEFTFSVTRSITFLLTADYQYGFMGASSPPIQPFLTVAGTSLFLPEPQGDGAFAFTLVLPPGTYTFSAVTSAVTTLPAGGATSGTSSIDLTYSFTIIPGPATIAMLGLFGFAPSRRRRA